MLQLLGGEAGAGIADADANTRGCDFSVLHLNGSLLLVIFYRVGNQVDEHLLQPGSIRTNKVMSIGFRKNQFDTALLRLRFAHALTFEHHFRQEYRFLRQWDLS